MEKFDWQFYRYAYPQLKIRTSREAITHYKKIGKTENLLICKPKLPSDFDCIAYITFNPDLSRNIFTKESAMVHYVTHGHKENRICNLNEYVNRNKKYHYDMEYTKSFETILRYEGQIMMDMTEKYLLELIR